jgi:hypothetical protein
VPRAKVKMGMNPMIAMVGVNQDVGRVLYFKDVSTRSEWINRKDRIRCLGGQIGRFEDRSNSQSIFGQSKVVIPTTYLAWKCE